MKRPAAALALSLLATGCSTQRGPVPAAPAPPVIVTPPPGPAMSPATYVASSASFELFVLGAAELAASRAQSSRLRAHAGTELADHRGLSAQLSFAGRGLNLLPPRAMGNSDARHLAELEASSSFDALYKKRMIAAHQYRLEISRDVAERGTSPTLRPLARHTAEVLARHLDQLHTL